MSKIKLAPRNLKPVVSRKWSTHNVVPFLTPDFIQRFLSLHLYPFLSFFSLLSRIGGWTGGRKRIDKVAKKIGYSLSSKFPSCMASSDLEGQRWTWGLLTQLPLKVDFFFHASLTFKYSVCFCNIWQTLEHLDCPKRPLCTKFNMASHSPAAKPTLQPENRLHIWCYFSLIFHQLAVLSNGFRDVKHV